MFVEGGRPAKLTDDSPSDPAVEKPEAVSANRLGLDQSSELLLLVVHEISDYSWSTNGPFRKAILKKR